MGKQRKLTGAALQARRRDHFRRKPWCVRCAEKQPPVYRLATDLDHVIPIDKGGSDDPSNLQGLCAECHKDKTAAEFGWVRKARPVRVGVDGYPLELPN